MFFYPKFPRCSFEKKHENEFFCVELKEDLGSLGQPETLYLISSNGSITDHWDRGHLGKIIYRFTGPGKVTMTPIVLGAMTSPSPGSATSSLGSII